MSTGPLTHQTIGGYQLLDLLGEGAVGTVYHGYNPRQNQHAAVKVLTNPASTKQASDVERFMLEARTIASLNHPHIVPLYDFGTDRGFNFIAMRLLTGGTLQDRLQFSLRNGYLPSLGEVAHLVSQLASALDYAHQQGVIHRDVKSTNVLFDDQGVVYLVDFSVVKLMDVTTWLTNEGMMVGTPAYMAPELWRGDTITPSIDQYALGVLTYQLLSGRLPFDAPSPHALMYKHLNDQPPLVVELRPDVPAEVQNVLQKGLAKTPEDRYPSVTAFAQAFADAIRGAEGVPTGFATARIAQPAQVMAPPVMPPPTPVERVRPVNQPNNKNVLVPLMIGAGIGLLALTICTVVLFVGGLSVMGENDEQSPTDLPDTPEEIVLAEPTLTEIPVLGIATQIELPTEEEAAATEVVTGERLVDRLTTGSTQQIATINTPDHSVRCVAVQPGGNFIASGGSSGTVYVWNIDGGTPVMNLSGHTDVVYDLAYSPDGALLASASGDGTVRLWDSDSGQLIHIFQGHTGSVRSVDFNHNGTLLVSTGEDRTIRLWDVTATTQQQVFTARNERILSAAFSEDGTVLASGWVNNTVGVWDVASQSQLSSMVGHTSEIRAVDFSPTGLIASSSSDNTIRLWDVNSGETRSTMTQSRDVHSVKFSPDGSVLASGSSDNSVALWNVETGQMITSLQGHFGWVFDVDFNSEGTVLASAGGDGTVRLWQLVP